MELSKLRELVQDGKIFSCTFVKRGDGQLRHMVARTGVHKNAADSERNWDPDDKGLLCVYDMQKRGYRHIPIEGIQVITVRKQTMRVQGEPM